MRRRFSSGSSMSGRARPGTGRRRPRRAGPGRGGPEGALDLLALAEAQQAVVHEDAREPVADGAIDQRRRHRRVHAARQAADRPAVTDLHADRLDRLGHEVPRRPRRLGAADPEQEVLDDLGAARRVRDLRMELHAKERPRLVTERRHRRVGARGRDVDSAGGAPSCRRGTPRRWSSNPARTRRTGRPGPPPRPRRGRTRVPRMD